MSGHGSRSEGVIAWLVNHRVAPNLLMLVLLVGGLYMTTRITQEVFPRFDVDVVTVTVRYPGATPKEIEQGIILPIEEAVRGLDGIDKVTSTASEGSGIVQLELISGADRQVVFQDVDQAVSRIETFPEDAKQPQVSLSGWQRDVLDLLIYGDVPRQSLRAAAEQVRDRLLQSPGVTRVDLQDVRDHEIHIDVDEGRLRSYGLSFSAVADAVAANAQDHSAGTVDTRSGTLLLQVQGRRERAAEFRDIVVRRGSGGALVRLGDVAKISDGFADDTVQMSTYDGKPAIELGIARVGDQTPIGVANAARKALPDIMADLPPDIGYAIQRDRSQIYQQRLELLMKNAFYGLVLVLLLLSAFLEFKLAFWVTVGIPTSFLGAFLFLPWLGVSINMISLFAFIIALGIVVDDAIVAGENIYEYRQRGMGFVEAAVQGARDIAVPVIFSVLTNVVAFLPLAMIPGAFGQLWAVIPAVVSTVFVISLVEALVVLPAHLAHVREEHRTRLGAWLHQGQQRFSNAFSRFVENVYGPFLRLVLRYRYATLAAALAILTVTVAYPLSGRMGFILMPRVESDTAELTAQLPPGTPAPVVTATRDKLVDAARKVIAANGGDQLSRGIYAYVEDNEVEVRAYLTEPGVRPISTAEMARKWRQALGDVPGVDYLRFDTDRGGPGGGAAVTVQLSHSDTDTLNRAARSLAGWLSEVDGVTDVNDGYQPGKPQWNFRLTESGRALGLTANDLGRQIRAAFYGDEAFKLLRGGNEVTVRVRLPASETRSEAAVSSLMIHTPAGTYVPLDQVADITRGRALTQITRQDGRRTLTVSANVEPLETSNQVLSTLRGTLLPRLMNDYPGLTYSFEGRQASMRDAIESFFTTVTLALLGIYALLAIPFRSYTQPAVIMVAIPFGVVGAILGHLIMGYSLSVISIMGIIALSGVVVNDSLVLMDYANARRAEGDDPFTAVALAGVRRFRPIMLTTLTTFGGLAPMIFETSIQARFMIPMAISLGFGLLFATAILLLLTPCLYVILEDLKRVFSRKRVEETVVG